MFRFRQHELVQYQNTYYGFRTAKSFDLVHATLPLSDASLCLGKGSTLTEIGVWDEKSLSSRSKFGNIFFPPEKNTLYPFSNGILKVSPYPLSLKIYMFPLKVLAMLSSPFIVSPPAETHPITTGCNKNLPGFYPLKYEADQCMQPLPLLCWTKAWKLLSFM